MSRTKSRNNSEICADCGNADPTWASINKGIFLCVECCSIHRTFGRHISQVKSLYKSQWSPSQLLMVQTLNNNGVNNIWEHCLLDNNSKFLKRKPQPKDPLHPTKADFIRAKHQQFAFVFRPNRDDTLCTEAELSKQLHSSVRTGNLEMSVRLLIQGADPNYFHDEKGTTPLHVAAKANQVLQAELLMIYGADPSSPDAHGVSPIEYARSAGHKELAERLIESMYEVTDRLSFFVCGKKPDHSSGKHILVPENMATSDPISLSKLQKLPNHLFEELVADVYDEIDRRETEAIWLSCTDSLELSTIPFLPVDAGLSTTRNQGRQKLARFTAKELVQLICDMLNDIRRRQLNISKETKLSFPQNKHISQISDDEPLYDSVASDEDYAVLSTEPSQSSPEKIDTSIKSRSSEQPSTVTTSTVAFDMLTKRLLQSDSTINDLRAEVKVLQHMVEKLNLENNELRSRLSQTQSQSNSEVNSVSGSLQQMQITSSSSANNLNGLNSHRTQATSLNYVNNNHLEIDNSNVIDNSNHGADGGDIKTLRRGQRPTSMYETREGFRTPIWQHLKNQVKYDDSLRSSVPGSSSGNSFSLEQRLHKSTENVTHCIHDLWRCIQNIENQNQECCVPCADKIRIAVVELTSIVPQGAANDNVRLLLDSASRLQLECASLKQATLCGDQQEQEYFKQKVRACAYDIAKATKTLVTKFMQNSKHSQSSSAAHETISIQK